MSQAPTYTRSAGFADDERSNTGGRSTVRTAEVDAELDAIAVSLNPTIANLAKLQRDDGVMRDGVVPSTALGADTLKLLTTGLSTPRGAWTTATAYAAKDLVTQGGNTYISVQAHTSLSFATDLAAGKWMLFQIGANPNAAAMPFSPTANILSTTVQDAIAEVDANWRASISLSPLLATESQTAAAAQTVFDLTTTSYTPGASTIAVFIDGLYIPSSEYLQTSSTRVTFTSASFIGGEQVAFICGHLVGVAASAANVAFLANGTGAVARNVQDKLREIVSITDFGAIGNGVADDAPAIQAALNSGAQAVFVPTPSVAYYCASGLTQPAGVVFYGFGFAMDSTPSTPRGTTLLFATSVANCITMVNGGNRSAAISGMNIVRKTGTPPALSNAILNSGSYGVVIEKVLAANHAIGLTNKADGVSAGITMFADTFVTSGIRDSHLVIDSFPESRFVNCRFGSNGSLDFACNSFIRIQGGSTTNPASGPNTLVMTSCQFNQGANNAASWIAFNNQLPGSIADATDWQFSNCYIETASAGISSDGTWGAIGRLFMDNVNFNIASPFLDASLSVVDLNDWEITNCKFAGTLSYTSSTNHLNTFKVSNSTVTGMTGLNGAGTSISKVILSNNSYDGGLTVTGSFLPFSSVGGSVNGTATLSASGINYYLSNYTTGQTTWTPVLNINGSPTGITGTFQGEYTLNGRILTCTYRIILTAIGASTGQVTITGMPFPAAAGTLDHNGGAVVYAQNLVGLTGQLTARMSSTTAAVLSQSAATGTSAITQANLSATSIIYGAISYPI